MSRPVCNNSGSHSLATSNLTWCLLSWQCCTSSLQPTLHSLTYIHVKEKVSKASIRTGQRENGRSLLALCDVPAHRRTADPLKRSALLGSIRHRHSAVCHEFRSTEPHCTLHSAVLCGRGATDNASHQISKASASVQGTQTEMRAIAG